MDNNYEEEKKDVINETILEEADKDEFFRSEPHEYQKGEIYEAAIRFKKRHPGTVAWRLKKHAKIVENYLDHGETVNYVFAAQKSEKLTEIFYTNLIVLTNKRLILGKKRVLYGHSCTSITPEMYNDLKIKKDIIWGDVIIDTLHEKVHLSHIAGSALDEIETNINTFMLKEKKKFYMSGRKNI